MIIFKRKHLSIKWGIFAGILVFLAILLLLLFLLQTVYLDDIYKAAKKNTLNNANDKVEQVLEKQLGNLNVIEQQLDELTAEYDIDIQISGEDGTLLYSSLRMYENTLPKQFYQDFYKRAEKMAAVLPKKSLETFSAIRLICLQEMESCLKSQPMKRMRLFCRPRSQPVTETRRVNLLKMRILEMESVQIRHHRAGLHRKAW